MGGKIIFIGFFLLLAGLVIGTIVIEIIKSVVGLFIHDITYLFATLGFLEDKKEGAWPNCLRSDENFFAGGTPWDKFLRNKHFDAICAADIDIDQVCSLIKCEIVYVAKSSTATTSSKNFYLLKDRYLSFLNLPGS